MSHVALFISLASIAANPASASDPFVKLTIDEAFDRAAKEKKVVLINFFATWCGPCRMLDQHTWGSAEVRRWLGEHAIALTIDGEKEEALLKRFNVSGYPTILLLRPDRTEVGRIVGFRRPEEFLDEAGGALSGKDEVARVKEKLNDARKDDPMLRMKYGRALERQGNAQAAMAEYLWCFDHGNEHSERFDGVRLSILLNDLARLGLNYPPALDALRGRRDAAERRAMQIRASSQPSGVMASLPGRDRRNDSVVEAAALNRTLNDRRRTLVLFDGLPADADGAVLRRILLRDVIDELLVKGRYADVLAAVGDAPAEVDRLISTGEASLQIIARREPSDRAGAMASFRQQVVGECGKFYQAALGARESKQAQAIADRMLAFDGTAATYIELTECALDVGDSASARAMVRRGEQTLRGEDLLELQRAAREIPPERR